MLVSVPDLPPQFLQTPPPTSPPLLPVTLQSATVMSPLTIVPPPPLPPPAAPPQLKVTVPSKLPPRGRQASSAASVQLARVPAPTTHASACEVAPSTPKTSSARTSTNRVRTVVAFIACLRFVIAVPTRKAR